MIYTPCTIDYSRAGGTMNHSSLTWDYPRPLYTRVCLDDSKKLNKPETSYRPAGANKNYLRSIGSPFTTDN